ncbi:MAG: hypothetical protein AAF744_09505 [Pseudomonadota bacterium]
MDRIKGFEKLKSINAPKGAITAVSALAVALGVGFIMQSSDAAQQRYGGADVQEPAPGDAADGVTTSSSAILDVEDITLTSGALEEDTANLPAPEAEVIKASTPPQLEPPAGPEMTEQVAPEPACEMVANARPMAAAMVNLTLQAPCLPNERVAIHHNGMIFTQTTSDTGEIDISMPALAENAVFIVAFSNGEGAVAQTFMEEMKDFDRVVLQWKGDTGFEIHAREFGADYGAQGHIWRDAPGEMADAITGQSGFITRMGDAAAPDALLAEVYTFPASASQRAGNVALSVEAEVTALNCGLEIEAQTLEVVGDGEMKTRNLTLAVPECDATGSFLVLNNLIQDLKVAAN